MLITNVVGSIIVAVLLFIMCKVYGLSRKETVYMFIMVTGLSILCLTALYLAFPNFE